MPKRAAMRIQRHPICAIVPMALLAFFGTSPLLAQRDNPVYVDDSPQAWELFRQAGDQTRSNAGEAVRLYQDLLDEYPHKLIPAGERMPDHFVAVRERVLRMLSSNESLLQRYRVMQTARAQQMLEADALEPLAASRSLTEPGLEALLRLAQRDIERAKFHSGMVKLNEAVEHPDCFGRRAAHALFMRALAARYAGDQAAFIAAAEALSEFGPEAEPFHQSLADLAASQVEFPVAPGVNSLDRGQASDLSGLVAQAIWTVPLTDSLLRRRMEISMDESAPANPFIERRIQDASYNTALPTVAGPTVYINEGQHVRAFNRLTGRGVWDFAALKGRQSLIDRESTEALDPNVISVHADSLVTLTGHAQAANRSEGGTLVCINARTGEQRWPPASFDGLVESAAGETLYPHGAPVIVEGNVIVAARKVSPQLLTSAYVVAFDLATGEPNWVRYITSSGSLRPTPRPYDTVVAHGGNVYIASPVGAAAKLDATNGEIKWLRRFNVPINLMTVDQARRPWELTGPVMTNRGVLVIQPDQRRVTLLDDDTGDLLESHSASSAGDWNLPRYLLAAGDMVYGIGSEIRAFHLDDLASPLWRLPTPHQSDATARTPAALNASSALELRGRVQAAEHSLIVPSSDGLLIVDHQTGAITQKLPVQPMGNALALDSQLLVASGDRVEAFMSFDRAQAMLRERIAKAPDEPEPALSLLRLGMRVRQLSLCLEAAEMTATAIRKLAASTDITAAARASTARDELSAVLLELAGTDVAASADERELLFAALSTVASENRHRIEYLLAYADWLARDGNAVDRAVETYQTILSTKSLALEPRTRQGVTRAASAWVNDRLRALIEQRGQRVYAPQEDFARLRLNQVLAAEPSAESLLALAEEFPFSDAAVQASLEAARIRLKQQDARGALAALHTTYHAAPLEHVATQLLGEYVRICQLQGWLDHARTAAQHAIHSFGDVPLGQSSAGPPRNASAWLEEIEAAIFGQPVAAPRLGVVGGDARPIAGRLVPAYANAGITLPANRAIIHNGDAFQLIDSKTMTPGQPAAVEGAEPRILRFDQRGILIWMGGESGDPRAVMLDWRTGALRWTTPRLTELLAPPSREGGRSRGIRETLPTGELFDASQILPLLTNDTLILVRRGGAAVAFDLADGTRVRWPLKQVMEQVHFVAACETALVIAGLERLPGAMRGDTGTIELTPRITVLDPRSGDRLQSAENAANASLRYPVRWLVLSEFGKLYCGGDGGAFGIDLHGGRRLWTNANPAANSAQQAWNLGRALLIKDQRAGIRKFNTHNGELSEPFETPLRGEWNPMEFEELIAAGDRVAARYRQRVVVYSHQGQIAGADIINDDQRDYRWLLHVQGPAGENRLLLINSRAEQAPVGDRPGLRARYRYWVFPLSDSAALLSEANEIGPLAYRVTHAAAIDGWLLLSAENETLAVPMEPR